MPAPLPNELTTMTVTGVPALNCPEPAGLEPRRLTGGERAVDRAAMVAAPGTVNLGREDEPRFR